MPLSTDAQTKLRQVRMDALSARHLHEKRLAVLRPWSVAVDILGITVPFIYFVARYVAKGTELQHPVDTLGEFLAGLLLVLAAVKMGKTWSDKIERHSRGAARSILLANEVLSALSDPVMTDDAARGMLRTASELDVSDRADLNPVTRAEKQEAYRTALSEIEPHVRHGCENCGAFPLDFVPGTCQRCGGTPTRKEQ